MRFQRYSSADITYTHQVAERISRVGWFDFPNFFCRRSHLPLFTGWISAFNEFQKRIVISLCTLVKVSVERHCGFSVFRVPYCYTLFEIYHNKVVVGTENRNAQLGEMLTNRPQEITVVFWNLSKKKMVSLIFKRMDKYESILISWHEREAMRYSVY